MHNIDKFEENGFILINSSNQDSLTQIIKASQLLSNIEHDRRIIKNWTNTNKVAKHFVAPHLYYKEFENLIFSPQIIAFINQIWGRIRTYIYNSKISIKRQGEKHLWVPHQDSAYKNRRVKGFTACIFLEDADQNNGSIQVFPQSHKLGKLEHKMIVKGDCNYQLVVKALPKIKPQTILAQQGDILIMSSDMIHQSQFNKTEGNRPIFIFEVEQLNKFAVDEYGKIPLMITGEMNQWEKLMSQIIHQLNITTIKQNCQRIYRQLISK